MLSSSNIRSSVGVTQRISASYGGSEDLGDGSCEKRREITRGRAFKPEVVLSIVLQPQGQLKRLPRACTVGLKMPLYALLCASRFWDSGGMFLCR